MGSVRPIVAGNNYTSPFGKGVKEHPAMVAIAAILIFIVAIGALNWFEFGRID